MKVLVGLVVVLGLVGCGIEQSQEVKKTTQGLTCPAPKATVVCAQPPPSCPAGFSPQFTAKHVWECTDCGLVVTFGGIFGNYRRCVNNPTLTCPTGEVPTFGLEEETWQCKPTCDNGMYDQHTVKGVLVCVPC